MELLIRGVRAERTLVVDQLSGVFKMPSDFSHNPTEKVDLYVRQIATNQRLTEHYVTLRAASATKEVHASEQVTGLLGESTHLLGCGATSPGSALRRPPVKGTGRFPPLPTQKKDRLGEVEAGDFTPGWDVA